MADISLPELRQAVWRADLAIAEAGLVTLSFGNASGLDAASGIFLIKPSGDASNPDGHPVPPGSSSSRAGRDRSLSEPRAPRSP